MDEEVNGEFRASSVNAPVFRVRPWMVQAGTTIGPAASRAVQVESSNQSSFRDHDTHYTCGESREMETCLKDTIEV